MNRLSLIALVAGVSLMASSVAMGRGPGGGGGRGGFGGGHGGHGMGQRGGHGGHIGHGRSSHAPARSTHAPRVVSRPVAAPRPVSSHVRVATPISRATAQPVARAGKMVSGKTISLAASRSSTTAARTRTLSAQTTGTLQRLAGAAGLNAETRVALGAALGGRALSLRQRMLLLVAARNNRGLTAAERGGLADDLAGDEDMPEVEAEEPQEPETLLGMEIQDMSDGPAMSQGMKVGDIILAINGQATPDFDSLRAALEAAGQQADVVFINVDNGQTERVMLPVDDTRIGATVEQVQVN